MAPNLALQHVSFSADSQYMAAVRPVSAKHKVSIFRTAMNVF